MIKFIIAPDNSSYSVTDGVGVIRTALEGGAGRYRKDVLNSTSIVIVSWVFNQDQYKYFRSFFRGLTDKGAKPFLIDLVLDDFVLTEHKAFFIPESVNLSSQEGCAHFVSAKLEVYPNEDTDNGSFAFIYSAFGPNWTSWLDKLQVVVNNDWPEVL